MARYVMECPKCGNYVEARKGLFAKKNITCSCGEIINVRANRMAARECPHCGNVVVFDQSKGEKAVCPVCHELINTQAQQSQQVEFHCARCGILLRTKEREYYDCPVCDCENDVQERLTAERIRNSGLASVIKYEGDNDTLVWKHPIEDFNMGSQLIVHESQEAIFFRDGQALDLFGAGRYTLETQQLPILEKLFKLPADASITFHSEVYYINLTTLMGIKWGTDSKVRLFDPVSHLSVDLGASGEFNIRVTDSRRLLLKTVGTAHGLEQGRLLGGEEERGYFRGLVMTQAKSHLAQAISALNLSVLELDAHLMELSDSLREKINRGLAEYGLMMPEFFITRIITPDDDPNFQKMREQYAAEFLLVREEEIRKAEAEAAMKRKAVEAQTEAQQKVIGAQGEAEALRIQKQAEAEAYLMQASAEAQEMKMKGYTYQQETVRSVGMEAMKNGIVGVSSDGSGGSAVGDVAGLGVALGAMGGVMNMTKQALDPIVDDAGSMAGSVEKMLTPQEAASVGAAAGWTCASCGTQGITSKFCPECGARRPEEPGAWTCPSCGMQGITSKFCPECGTKRPEESGAWTCPSCGMQGIMSKFCPECGTKRPEEKSASWNCPECGTQGIIGKFCPDCGSKRPDTSN